MRRFERLSGVSFQSVEQEIIQSTRVLDFKRSDNDRWLLTAIINIIKISCYNFVYVENVQSLEVSCRE